MHMPESFPIPRMILASLVAGAGLTASSKLVPPAAPCISLLGTARPAISASFSWQGSSQASPQGEAKGAQDARGAQQNAARGDDAAKAKTGGKNEVDDSSFATIPGRLDWERDKRLVIARVDGQEIKLAELGHYIRDHYDPQLLTLWGNPDGSRDLNSTAVSQLLWQYADLQCLRSEVKARKLPMAGLKVATDKILESGFKEYLAQLEKNKRKLTPASRAMYFRRFKREQGLRAESRALLDLLVPARYLDSQLRDWHNKHGDVYFGRVEAAHILIRTRDEASGRLLPPKERRRRYAFAAQLATRLKETPQDFAKLAKAHSHDKATKAAGGKFRTWLPRFETRLPAPLVRAAWNSRDGEVSGPVESYYGYHIVRRLDRVVKKYILYYGGTIQQITEFRAKDAREDFLSDMRKRHEIRLYM